MTVGEQLIVTAKPLQRCRPLGTLPYPVVPSEALRSRLVGQVIECKVSCESNGQVSAECVNNLPDIPPFIFARAKELLERNQWQPALGEKDQPVSDQIVVNFKMEPDPQLLIRGQTSAKGKVRITVTMTDN